MKDDLADLVGKRLKELRKKKGYTQDKFSELLGIDSKHLSRIECGKTQPSLNLLKKAAKIFGIDLSCVFEVEHLDTKDTLIFKINKILEDTKEEDIKLFYKIIKSITH